MAHKRRTFLRAIAAGSIGSVVLGGTATAATTTTVEGGGEDIWDQEDEFHYYYEEVDGDFDVTVHNTSLENTDSWAKTGIMVRQTLNADAENAMVRRRPNGEVSLQWRSDNGDDTVSTTSDGGSGESEVSGGSITADWLRLTRSGDTISAYGSTDGSNWTLIANIAPSAIDFAGSAYVGLAVTSHSAGTLCAAEFESLSGISPGSTGDVGDVDVAGSVSTGDGGGGDTDPIISTGSASDVTNTSATLNGALDSLGGASSADVYFEWHESGASGWNTTNAKTLTATDSFSQGVSGLSSGVGYEFRAVTDASDGDSDTGSINTFTAAEDGEDGTSGGSNFDGGDGFASMGSWLDDSTQVITVTEPTRSAVESAFHASGPRVVVFETSGTIDLGGETLQITEDNCWVAGQTAPSPGITFIKGMVQVDANNCVIQHVRSRIGPGDGSIQGNDAINTQDDTQNNVIDHMTASWGVDECLSVGYDTQDTTVTNCLIYEGLWDPYGDGSDHNYGTLIGDGASNVTFAGNVWAKIRGRVPRLKSDTETVIVNNFAYFFDYAATADSSAMTSFVGNGYTGPLDTGNPIFEGDPTAYHTDNYAADPPLDDGTDFAETDSESSPPLWPNGLSEMPSEDVESHNLATAGARPADRTENDQRIIQEIENRAGNDRLDSPYDYWVGHQDEVGDYPSLPENTHSLSVPSSGLRDWLEQWALSVEEPGVSPP